MTPYRTFACAEDVDPNEAISCTDPPLEASGCPTCGASFRQRLWGGRAPFRNPWSVAIGMLAALTLLVTSLAGIRLVQLTNRALRRMDRQEARQAKHDGGVLDKQLAALNRTVRALRADQKRRAPSPDRRRGRPAPGPVSNQVGSGSQEPMVPR